MGVSCQSLLREKKTSRFPKTQGEANFVAPGGVVLKLAHIHVHCIENLEKNPQIPQGAGAKQVSKKAKKGT